MAENTQVNTAAELEAALRERGWAWITGGVNGGPQTTTAIVCPFCSAMVPPGVDSTGVDHKQHHITYHVEMWKLIDRKARNLVHD